PEARGPAELEARQGISGEQAAEEGNAGRDSGDEESVPRPLREHGQLEQVVEVLEGRVQREEGIHLDVVQLPIGTDGGDHHPVEREQRRPNHQRQGDMERDCALEGTPVAYGHGQSLFRMYQSWNTMTMRRNGKRKSEIEAP